MNKIIYKPSSQNFQEKSVCQKEKNADMFSKQEEEDLQQKVKRMIFPVYQSLIRIKEEVEATEILIKRLLNSDLQRPLYIISSIFLIECLKYLTSEKPEILHFVTGVQIGDIRIMDKMSLIDMKNRSSIHAEGEIKSTANELIKMDIYGHSLLGIFHSHPGDGIEWAAPSHVDVDTQRRYEKGGYQTIGGVFTRDGYVRFFSYKMDFEISIYGKGVKSYGDKIFNITQI